MLIYHRTIVYIYAFFPTCCVACMHALPAVLTQESVYKECNQSPWLKKQTNVSNICVNFSTNFLI